MSVQKMWEVSLNILQIPLFIAIIAVLAKKTGKQRGLFAAFFMFALMALALEDIYWITYDILRPDTWMPFAADEFAGSAAILLLGSMLATKLEKKSGLRIPELVFSVVFMAGHAGLWIAWSGEWFQDIVSAIPYVYFVYVLLSGMKETKALTRAGTYLALAVCTFVIALDFIALSLDEGMANLLYNINYVILNGTTVLLYVKILRFGRDKNAGIDVRERTLFLTFALYLWSRLVVYMSSELFYNIGLGLHILTLPLMLWAVIRVMDAGRKREEVQDASDLNGGMT